MSTAQEIVNSLAKRYEDWRVNVFDVEVKSQANGCVVLTGRVLDEQTLQALRAAFQEQLPIAQVEDSQVQVLRKPQPKILSVATNITSLQREPSWLSEMVSQLLYGWPLEVLYEQDRWGYVRQEDGYMGWAYLPYLQEKAAPEPTHLVISPACELRSAPKFGSPVLTRVVAGTPVRIVSREDDWEEIIANRRGWVHSQALRSLFEMPTTTETRRAMMMADATRMVGVPYDWGGCSANGIDCSGLAQLLHRWVGVTIPRDADMQFAAGRPVEPPFEPGDLVFFGGDDGPHRITHVAISTGGWNIVHSSRSQNGVYYDDIQAVPHLKRDFLFGCTYIR
jgi:SH3-like domain-containing protein